MKLETALHGDVQLAEIAYICFFPDQPTIPGLRAAVFLIPWDALPVMPKEQPRASVFRGGIQVPTQIADPALHIEIGRLSLQLSSTTTGVLEDERRKVLGAATAEYVLRNWGTSSGYIADDVYSELFYGYLAIEFVTTPEAYSLVAHPWRLSAEEHVALKVRLATTGKIDPSPVALDIERLSQEGSGRMARYHSSYLYHDLGRAIAKWGKVKTISRWRNHRGLKDSIGVGLYDADRVDVLKYPRKGKHRALTPIW